MIGRVLIWEALAIPTPEQCEAALILAEHNSLRAAYRAAWEAHRDAIERNDSRDMYDTRRALNQANTAMLRAGI
jgi:hypothetical protein